MGHYPAITALTPGTTLVVLGRFARAHMVVGTGTDIQDRDNAT